MLQSMGSQRVRHDLATEQHNNILPNSIKQQQQQKSRELDLASEWGIEIR